MLHIYFGWLVGWSVGCVQDIVVASPDSRVLEIMRRYQQIQVPTDAADVSHFKIYVCHEHAVSKPVLVPSPLVLQKNCCFLWYTCTHAPLPFTITWLLFVDVTVVRKYVWCVS